MKFITIINTRNNKELGNKIGLADNPWYRFTGLMGKKAITADEGLLLTPCNSIHMFFMKFSIDVVFIDRNKKIIRIVENLKPWRLSPVVFMTQSVLELPAGTISKTESQVGDILEIKK